MKTLDFRPFYDEQVTFLRSDADRIEVEYTLGPGASGPPLHVHPTQTEHYRVLKGRLRVNRDGAWSVLEEGDEATILPNTPHTFEGVDGEPVTFLASATPAGAFEAYFDDLHRLVASGTITEHGLKEGIYQSLLVAKYPDTLVAAQPGMRMAMRVMALVGRALGYRV